MNQSPIPEAPPDQPLTVPPVAAGPADLDARFDELAQIYLRIERLLAQYIAHLQQGQLATGLLAELYQGADQAAAIVASLSAAKSALPDSPTPSSASLAEKRQQVLQILSRVLQYLAQAEQRTRELCAQLNPQAEALCQAANFHRAYELALATFASTATTTAAASSSGNLDDDRTGPPGDRSTLRRS